VVRIAAVDGTWSTQVSVFIAMETTSVCTYCKMYTFESQLTFMKRKIPGEEVSMHICVNILRFHIHGFRRW
jgi:hypothetical protein